MTAPRPTSVKVGPHKYSVEFKHPISPTTCGETDNHNLKITVDDTLAPTMQRQVFLHEILHACFWNVAGNKFTNGKSERLTEEDIISSLEAIMFGVIVENPALMKWMEQR